MASDPRRAAEREVLRFAPSPNGLLHIGHAYSALFGHDMARRLGGRFLLRIEDIDRARCRPELVAAIFDDLAWLGLEWEQPVRCQSEHFDDYDRALARLRQLGVVYPCFATRTEIEAAVRASAEAAAWPVDPDGAPLYPGLYRDAAPGEIDRLMREGRPYALRLHMRQALALAEAKAGGPLTFEELGAGTAGERGRLPIAPQAFGDVVIARKEVPTSYHLAVVVDDALQGVTLVTRGQDLFAATSVHRVLQVLLDLPAPRYHHHGLVRDDSGRRLSKSAADRALRAIRAEGKTPADIRALVGL